jgi:hypothetical protein
MKNQYFGDKRDLFKYDLWLEIAKGCGIKRHTFIPMLTPDDSTTQGGRRPADAGAYRRSIFDFLKRCGDEERRDIKRLRAFFRAQSLVYHPYRDTERGYFKHRSRGEYFAAIQPDWLRDAAILVDPDIGLATRGPSWKKRPEKYVLYKEVADVASAARGKSVILLFQFLRPDAEKRKGDLREKEQRLRDTLREVGFSRRPIPWIAERQRSREGHSLPRELAFFIIAVEKRMEDVIEAVVQDYSGSRGLLSSFEGGEVPTSREAVEMGAAKEEARKLIELLPDHATWDDIIYEFYVKKKLAKVLEEAAAGEVVSHEAAKEHLSSR